jgi:hypothetical protein
MEDKNDPKYKELKKIEECLSYQPDKKVKKCLINEPYIKYFIKSYRLLKRLLKQPI